MNAPGEGALAHNAAHGVQASFSCAVCGGIAGLVRLAAAATVVDMGPPIGDQEHQADGVVISHWIGTVWKAAAPATYAQVRDVLSASQPDTGAPHRIDWELAPFCCRACQQNYCREHWECIVIMDEGFYDRSDGICPAGHRQVIDD
jgi:hypothetical protein